VADAHVAAVQRLMAGPVAEVFNVGTGRGHSVLEVIARTEEISGRPVPHRLGPRRPGDPPEVVADPGRIAAELGWTARHDLTDMIASAWKGWSGS
jgi:UDP-glucose 4-epimerase